MRLFKSREAEKKRQQRIEDVLERLEVVTTRLEETTMRASAQQEEAEKEKSHGGR